MARGRAWAVWALARHREDHGRPVDRAHARACVWMAGTEAPRGAVLVVVLPAARLHLQHTQWCAVRMRGRSYDVGVRGLSVSRGREPAASRASLARPRRTLPTTDGAAQTSRTAPCRCTYRAISRCAHDSSEVQRRECTTAVTTAVQDAGNACEPCRRTTSSRTWPATHACRPAPSSCIPRQGTPPRVRAHAPQSAAARG
jgi:hypothetical protein